MQHPLFVVTVAYVFVTAGACVGATSIVNFGKQVGIVCLHGRGVYRNCKQGRSRPSLAVLFGHLQEQIVLTEPLRKAHFLPALMAAAEISLVQIMVIHFGLGDFLHDIFESTMVGTCFSGRFHTFSGPPDHKSESLSYRFRSSRRQFRRPCVQSYHPRKRYPSGY